MRLRPFIGWAVFFFIAAVIAQSVPSLTGSYYFLKGKGLFAKGDYQGAAVAYERSVVSDPDFARGYIELGLSYNYLEKYAQAEEAFKKAVSIHDDSCGQCGLGMVYHLQGKNEEAEKALRKATTLNPQDSCAFNQLGRMYYKLDKYPEAIEAFQTDVKLRPTATSYHFLGNSHLYSNQFEKALTAYNEALRLKPKYYRVHVYMGHAYNNLRRWPEAREAYRNAIKADPDEIEARVGLTITELELGNPREASDQYEHVRRLDTEWADKLLAEMERRAVKAASQQ